MTPININSTALIAAPSTAGTFTANLNSNAATLTGAPSTTNYTSKSSVVAYDNLGNPVTLDTVFRRQGPTRGKLTSTTMPRREHR